MLVLRESFDYPFSDIAEILDISEPNARQILSRARRRIDDERPRFDSDPRERGRLVARFLDAAREGDMEGLVALLAPDAVMIGDGGGKARAIAAPMHGAARIARALLAFYKISEEWGVSFEPAIVNGQPGFRTARARRPARQHHVARRRGRRDHPPALDRQPRQAGPPRADIRRRAAPGADNPTGMTPATPRAGRLRNGDIAPHAQHALHQLPPRDGSLQPRRRCPRGSPPRSQPGVVS